MNKPLLLAAALALPLLCSVDARASGFVTARFGGEHGSPVATNPTAIYYNPAGLAESDDKWHVFVDGNIAFRSSRYAHTPAATDVPEPAGAEGGNNGEARLFNVAAAPMIGVSGKLFEGFAIGFGAYVPFGGAATWSTNDKFEDNKLFAGPVDGQQRWYSITGAIQTFYFTLAAAYKIPDTGLSIGLSGNLNRSRVNTLRAREASGTNDIEAEGRSVIDVDGWNGSFGVGAMFEAMPKKLWIGASYQSRPGITGMSLKGHLKNNLAGQLTDDEVELHQKLPDIYRLGVRFAPTDTIELRLFGDLTRWSALDEQCLARIDEECGVDAKGAALEGSGTLQYLPRNWHDAGGVRAGASFWVKPEVELFTGLGFDGNAVPDETLEPALTDFNKVSAALGGRFEIMKDLHAATSYTHLFYFSRDNSGKSTLSTDYDPPARGPDAGGSYSQWIGVVNVNVDVAF